MDTRRSQRFKRDELEDELKRPRTSRDDKSRHQKMKRKIRKEKKYD
jgi:hypothetical protein